MLAGLRECRQNAIKNGRLLDDYSLQVQVSSHCRIPRATGFVSLAGLSTIARGPRTQLHERRVRARGLGLLNSFFSFIEHSLPLARIQLRALRDLALREDRDSLVATIV